MPDNTILVAALEAHNHDEWYSALLHSALEETGDPAKAVKVADAAFAQHPTDPSVPQPDDADTLFAAPTDAALATDGGKWITIGGHAEGEEKHVGGFPVQISEDGTILKGRLQGKNVKDVKEYYDAQRKEKKSALNPVSAIDDKPASGHNAPGQSKPQEKAMSEQTTQQTERQRRQKEEQDRQAAREFNDALVTTVEPPSRSQMTEAQQAATVVRKQAVDGAKARAEMMDFGKFSRFKKAELAIRLAGKPLGWIVTPTHVYHCEILSNNAYSMKVREMPRTPELVEAVRALQGPASPSSASPPPAPPVAPEPEKVSEQKHVEPDGLTVTVSPPAKGEMSLYHVATVAAPDGTTKKIQVSPSKPLDAAQSRQIRSAGKSPADYRVVNTTIVRKSVADYLDGIHQKLASRRDANVPGIEELKQARNKTGADYDRLMAGDGSAAGQATGGSTGAKYPRAALWLKAEQQFYAAGSADRADAARLAMQILEEGGSEEEASRALQGKP